MMASTLPADDVASTETAHRIVLIDGSLPGARDLAHGVSKGSHPFFLDPTLDLASQIRQAGRVITQTGAKLDSVDFVTHGADGHLRVGGVDIDAASIRQLGTALAPLRALLREQGSIRLYGCNVAQGESGKAFVHEFSRATGLPVQASVNPTGSPQHGGDWTLEFATHPIANPGTPPFLPGTLEAFDQTLALAAGDIVILRVEDNGTAVAKVKWAPLVDLPSGTSFVITDRSWINGPAFFPTLTAEGSVTITAQATISAGEVFTLDISVPSSTTLKRDSDNSQSAATFSLSGWSGNSFTLTTAGDNLFVYDGADSSPNFIFGFLFTGVTVNRDGTTGWSTSTSAATTSLLPSSLTSGTTALAINTSSASIRHLAYNGLTSTATRAQWLSRIATSGNWNSGTSGVTGSFGSLLSIQGPNTTPTFVGSTTTLNVSENASATSLTSLLHVSDTDSSQTLTWSQSSAPSHGTLNFSSATASSGSADITPGGTITYTPTSGYIGSDSFTVQVSDGTATATRTITVTVADSISPIVSIGSPSAVRTRGGPITYTVTYTDAHFSASTLASSDITVNSTGSASAGSVEVTGSGDTRTVTLSSITGDGTLGISIASGTGSDTSGNSAGSAGPSTTFIVDNTAPTVSIGSPSTSLTKSGPVRFTVSFSDGTASLLANQVVLHRTGNVSVSSIGVSGSGLTRTVTLSSITGTGTVAISIPAGAVTDTAGNTSVLTGPSATSEIDNTVPSVSIGSPSSSLTSGDPITYTITYSDANFSSSSLSVGNITVNSTGTASAGSLEVTGSGTTRTVTLSSFTGNGTLGISLTSGTGTDAVGNLAGAVGPSTTFAVDTTAPSINSIQRQDPTDLSTTLSSVQFRVNFTEAVSNVDTSDFELTTTGTASGSIATVSASSGTTFDVTVNSITGTGTLRLDLKSSGTGIQDGAANGVSGGFTSGQTYSVSPPNAAPSLGTSVGTTSFTEAANASSTPVVIDSALTVSDTDDATLASATVSITGNFQSAEDVLAFTNDLSTMGNIAGSYDSGTGVLTLASSGATATVSEWQIALRAVTYSNTAEEPNTTDRTVTWVVNDGIDASSPATKTVSVTATNDAPTSILLSTASIAENQASGTTVGTLSANDPDPSDTVSFSLVSGTGSTDNASFQIVGTSLQTTAAFNFESKNSYSIRVRATDPHSATFEQTFTITVTNVNEAPTFSGYSFTANQDTATSILLAKILSKSSDPEGSARTVSAADSTSAQGGTVELLGTTVRYTPPGSFSGADSFGVTLSDGTLTTTGTVSVTVAGSTMGAGQSMVTASASGGDVLLKFSGVPGRSYQILHTTTLPPTSTWSPLTTVTANGSGLVIFTHVSPPSPSYWRTLLVP